MNSNRLKPFLGEETEGIKILQGGFCIVAIPNK